MRIENIGPYGPAPKPDRLPKEIFFEAAKALPLTVVECVIVAQNRGILLTKRDDGDFFQGEWHVPGGYLFGQQPPEFAAMDVLKRELGLAGGQDIISSQISDVQGTFFNPQADPRGPMFHFVYEIKGLDSIDETENRKFFKKLPENTIRHHKQYLEKLGYVLPKGYVVSPSNRS